MVERNDDSGKISCSKLVRFYRDDDASGWCCLNWANLTLKVLGLRVMRVRGDDYDKPRRFLERSILHPWQTASSIEMLHVEEAVEFIAFCGERLIERRRVWLTVYGTMSEEIVVSKE
jgi:GT2 family glycosyltransferase